ncbi:MAG: cyclopropane-fatty-acyl-phospholipid synthase [Gammaproteobacteria bacterium]|jgi:cyclopropane-fatty-acyl-phospholipid synthase
MRTTILNQDELTRATSVNLFIIFSRKMLRKKMASLDIGCIAINDVIDNWKTDEHKEVDITIDIHDMRFYLDVMIAGSNGVASAYRDGYWSCDDLTGLFQLMIKNLDNTDNLDSGFATLGNWWLQRRHKARSNTKQGSQKNIQAHYDLGNEMFELFLDPSMTYSSGIFRHEKTTLEGASFEKLDRICRKLELKTGHHLVEIGSGWGSFAIHAAKYYGCHVTTTTISKEQYKLAKQRIQEQGLAHLIDIKLCDYRDLKGEYDKLVSIEMIEAVGHEFLAEYFSTCASLLKKDGQMMIQAITMPDQRYKQYLKTSDFIQQFIFPGSCVPSLTAMVDAITKSSDLRVNHIEDFGPHYAKTLRAWLINFMGKKDEIKQHGYEDDFIRLWEYYFCYCEAGFNERYTGVVQMLMNKPAFGREAL